MGILHLFVIYAAASHCSISARPQLLLIQILCLKELSTLELKGIFPSQ